MKNNKILACLILAMVFTVQGFVLAELNEKYTWVFSNDDTTISYDKETVRICKDTSTNTPYVEAWVKYEYLPQGSINLVNRAKQIGSYFEGMEKVKYILYHQCYASDTGFSIYGGIAHAKKIKILQTVYCDAEGQVIKQSNAKAFTDVEWIDIPEYISTRSGPEMLFDAVTAYAQKQEQAGVVQKNEGTQITFKPTKVFWKTNDTLSIVGYFSGDKNQDGVVIKTELELYRTNKANDVRKEYFYTARFDNLKISVLSNEKKQWIFSITDFTKEDHKKADAYDSWSIDSTVESKVVGGLQ